MGSLKASGAPHDIRYALGNFIRRWGKRTGFPLMRFIDWSSIVAYNYYNWQGCYRNTNEHKTLISREFCLNDWKKKVIIASCLEHRLAGYRRLVCMMLDRAVVSVSPTAVIVS